MTADDVYASVLRFLDQFIERGAAPDVVDLRARLASDQEVRQLLDDQLPSSNVSEREGFDAMTAFLDAMGERGAYWPRKPGGSPDLAELVDWNTWWQSPTSSEPETLDPAQWHDWLESVVVPESTQPDS